MLKHRNIIKSTAEYTRTYDSFKGMGGKSDKSNPIVHTENMYKNRLFGEGDVLESIPGYRRLKRFDGRINGIYLQSRPGERSYMYIHAGNGLYRTDRNDYREMESLTKIGELEDCKSSSYSLGSNLFIIDGKSITELDEDGAATRLTADEYSIAHTPTTFVNGEPYERRNLLTPSFRECFKVTSADDIARGTSSLTYSVLDEEKCTCAVTGCGYVDEGCLYIPRYATVNEKKYRVTQIADGAFTGNNDIISVITPIGLEAIGKSAFFAANNLSDVFISNTVKSIGDYCFYSCSSLVFVHLGSGLEYLSQSSFSACPELHIVNYSGSEEMFNNITNSDVLNKYDITFNQIDDAITVAIPVLTPLEEITGVKIDGYDADYYFSEISNEIVLSFDSRGEIVGKTVTVEGLCQNVGGFISTNLGQRIEPIRAILECTVCCVFDGRIFLSGNPYLRGAVFYSGLTGSGDINPYYFPVDSYFVDGPDEITVKGIGEVSGALAVLKSSFNDSSDIFFHKPKGNGKNKTYPISAPSCRFSPTGECIRFYDELIFAAPSGLYAISGQSGEARCISAPINHLLLKEDQSCLRLSAWGTYLVVSSCNSIYLADAFPRLNGDTREYQWYYLNGIGDYEDDYAVYRYCDSPVDGMTPSERAGEICESEVYSYQNESGDTVYYCIENNVRYPLYENGERSGGDIYAISAVRGSANLLLFGCENGALCVFNTDMCGSLPEHISQKNGFDYDAYDLETGAGIHPYYYSFEGHAPRYAVVTAEDDCEVDYLEKTTVPRSTVLRLKSFPGSSVTLRVVTGERANADFSSIGISKTNFEDTDFSELSAVANPKVTVTVDDRSRGWIQKQLALISDKPYSPFGVYSMSYRYKIKSPIKNKSL